MLNLTGRQQIAIGLALTLLMLLTRSHHWASLHSLPDASWAIFFLLGVYVRPLWMVPALIAASVGIDYAAITWGGVSDFCVSPAYWMLIPAYLALFAGGRFYARGHSLSPLGLARLVGVALVPWHWPNCSPAADFISSPGALPSRRWPALARVS